MRRSLSVLPSVVGLWCALLFCATAGQGASLDRWIYVGKHKLRTQVRGEGRPTIVLDAGMGDSLEEWLDLPERLADTTTVVAYDRAGLGQSDLGPEPRDARSVARELRLLLQSLRIGPPYVLVGHSLGCLHIRAFAEIYTDEVAGLVFIDATTEGMHESLKTEEGRADVMRQLEGESEGVKAEARGTRASLEQIAEIGAPPDVPAVVITAMAPISMPDEYRQEADAAGMTEERIRALQQRKFQLHSHLASQLPQGQHIVAEGSYHYIHHDEPELVVDEIIRLVIKLRQQWGRER